MYRIYDKDQQQWRNDMIVMPDGALAVLEKKTFNRYKVKVMWDEAPYVVHSETGVDDKNGTTTMYIISSLMSMVRMLRLSATCLMEL